MVTLVIEGSGGSEVRYEVAKDVFSIGASSGNDVIIRAPGVAPRHLIIQRKDEAFIFIGQSRQVAVLNGERRSRGVLRIGDRVRIGTATIVFSGWASDDQRVMDVVEDSSSVSPVEKAEGDVNSEGGVPADKERSEVVLYSEPSRIGEARTCAVELFRRGVCLDLIPSLKTFMERIFPERQAMFARVDDEGRFSPLLSQWTGKVPRLPRRTFEELAGESRYAVVRLGSRRVVVYPVGHGPVSNHAYFMVETDSDRQADDELILAELSRFLTIHWERVEQSSAMYGSWESEARAAVEAMVPGQSQGVQFFRESLIQAARSPYPVLLCGRKGVGRTASANLISSLNPNGPPLTRMYQVQEGSNKAIRMELWGLDSEKPTIQVESGQVLLKDIHLASLEAQREAAATILSDVESGLSPRVRWIATTEEDCTSLLNEGRFDPELYNIFRHHVIRVPSLQSRREDLPLMIVSLLDTVAAEQEKEIRGIELESLNSLLQHPFEGQMVELLAELRRLVSATPSGDMIRGIVPAIPLEGMGDGEGQDAAALLSLDDLKTVVPAVERLIIDRVMKRTKGNQSKAARVLNLSRGALISKIKEFNIPDYRFLRKR
ncbi:MAG: FHA domain-containing protein [Thermoanaerobaculales bacterium]|nr:FHA domain-containing protein [Thermoanaerobaculales bacterium]